ncbi:MAG TPA: MFS transporter [Aminobacterium sp.]|jgi:MFS family permease|uniref:MFS transporter n=1 Tax=Aminobacterium TaxID=81466 RepID=UPI000ED59E73|nr:MULTISPECIES: MFS transporter [unclassified Aminobacterium]HCA40695.1 MFS transporter [Aminobacterium sp.]
MSFSSKRLKILHFLGLRRSMIGLLSMVIFVGLGERLAERFLPIYLIALGGGSFSVGILNGLDNLLSALYSYPGGYLADQLGTKQALALFNLLAMSGFLIVVLVPHWWAVIGASFLFLSWSAVSLPATMKLISEVLPQNKRTMGVSLHSLVRRIPMALGPVIGGIMIGLWGETTGVRVAFALALLFAGVALVLQQKLIQENQSAIERPEKNPLVVFRLMSPALKNLLISDILVRFCEQIPYAFAVVWAMKVIEHPVSAFQFGILTTIEMAVAMLIYIPVAWLADRGGKKIFVVITFCFFTIFPLVLYHARSFWPLAGAFVIRGLKEFGEPTRKSLILDLAPGDKKAAMFGLYYLIRDVIVSIAAFGGAFLWMVSPALNFYVAFACGAAGTIWFAVKGKDLKRSTL